MNRRDFSRLSALALAATRLPAQSITATKPIGYAAIGLGSISDIFMRACAKSQQAKVTALVTGHADTKGAKYAAMYGIPKSSIYTYETFDRIRDNKDVDAVYVGLPNSMHKEYTVRAAQAGKHVLCEKPMAVSSAECREMIAACRQANVKLMIAYRCHYDPTHLETLRLIQSGAIGQIQSFEGAFGFNAPTKNFWRLDRKLAGGGSLMDVGIYPLNAMRLFSGEEPASFTAITSTRDKTSGRFSSMEETLNWTMKFPSGITASLASTYGADMAGFVRINGDKATLEIAPAFSYVGTHLKSLNSRIPADTTSPNEETFHFQLEAEHLVQCIRTNTQPKTPGEEGLADLIAMESIYQAAGAPIA